MEQKEIGTVEPDAVGSDLDDMAVNYIIGAIYKYGGKPEFSKSLQNYIMKQIKNRD